MPRVSEHSATELGSRTARQRLPIRRNPYFAHLDNGLSLGYRRASTGGTWVARRVSQSKVEAGAIGSARYEEHALGAANDAIESVGMSFQQAKKEAEDWLAGETLNEAHGVVRGSYSVAEAMEDYLKERERQKRKTLYSTRVTVKAHILPTLGKIELSKLTHGRVKAWRDALADAAPRVRSGYKKERVMVSRNVKGTIKRQYRERIVRDEHGKPIPLAPSFKEYDPSDMDALRKGQATANRILAILKAGLNHAHTETKRVATKAAWETVKPFRKVDVAKIRFLTQAEIRSLLEHCEPADFKRLVQGALLTGCRYGELARMRVSDFDAVNHTVFVAISKNGESRHVELNDEGIAFFIALTDGREPREHLFIKDNGKAWGKSEQKPLMDAACEAAGLEGVTFHIVRHSYASHLAMNLTPMSVIAQQLGHKDTRVTEKHYAHLGRAFVRDTIRTNLPSFGLSAS